MRQYPNLKSRGKGALNMGRVYVAYTGGTIGMMPTKDGYSPLRGTFAQAFNSLPELADEAMPECRFHEYDELLDSANMRPSDWNIIASDIAKNYDDFDGFVIFHGTDTMAYTASALSFMLKGLRKPVILTGSQIPLCRARRRMPGVTSLTR